MELIDFYSVLNFFLNPQVQGKVLGMSGKVQELQINRFHRFVFNLKARFE